MLFRQRAWAAEGEAAGGSSTAPLASAASSGAGPLPWLKSCAAGLMSPSVKSCRAQGCRVSGFCVEACTVQGWVWVPRVGADSMAFAQAGMLQDLGSRRRELCRGDKHDVLIITNAAQAQALGAKM